MRKDNIAFLIKETQQQDEKGVWHATEQRRKVFCITKSINAEEWHNGARNGLNPALKITLFSWDYNDEEIIEIDGKKYTVYRSYMGINDNIDLYLQIKKGKE